MEMRIAAARTRRRAGRCVEKLRRWLTRRGLAPTWESSGIERREAARRRRGHRDAPGSAETIRRGTQFPASRWRQFPADFRWWNSRRLPRWAARWVSLLYRRTQLRSARLRSVAVAEDISEAREGFVREFAFALLV